MAIGQDKVSIRIRGYSTPEALEAQKSIQVASINLPVNAQISKTDLDGLLQHLQPTTSATLSGANVTTQYVRDPSPGEAAVTLEVDDIFQDEFSDTVAVPTLVMSFLDGNGKTSNVNIKYMGNPFETQQFDSKVLTLANDLATLLGDYEFLTASLSLNGKDTVVAGND